MLVILRGLEHKVSSALTLEDGHSWQILYRMQPEAVSEQVAYDRHGAAYNPVHHLARVNTERT